MKLDAGIFLPSFRFNMPANRSQLTSNTRASSTVLSVSPKSRALFHSGEETWPMSSDTSPRRPSTLLLRTSTRRFSWMEWTSAHSSGDTLQVTWHPEAPQGPPRCVLSTPSTLPERDLPLMLVKRDRGVSSRAWETAWRRSSSLMALKVCTRASMCQCRALSSTELHTLASTTQQRVRFWKPQSMNSPSAAKQSV